MASRQTASEPSTTTSRLPGSTLNGNHPTSYTAAGSRINWYRSANHDTATPHEAPTAVPTAPMIPPCSTKMMRTLDDEAPIVLRIAMSRLFSMTRSTSDATMLRAATIMMSPMAMPMAIFSSHRAENSAWFNWPQSSAKYSAPRESVTARATAGASSRFSTRSSMRSTRSLLNSRPATSRVTKP